MGFNSTNNDSSLFTKFQDFFVIYILGYVDNKLITSNSFSTINQLISMLHNHFSLKDLGSLHYFLLSRFSWNRNDNIHLSQIKYIHNMLHETKMLGSNPQLTLMVYSLRLTLMVSSLLLTHDDTIVVIDPTFYHSIIGTQ